MMQKICNTTIFSLLLESPHMMVTQNQLKTQDMAGSLRGTTLGGQVSNIRILKLMFALMESLAYLRTKGAHVSSKYIQTTSKMFRHTRKSSTASMKNLSSKETTIQSVQGESNSILKSAIMKLLHRKTLAIQSKI